MAERKDQTEAAEPPVTPEPEVIAADTVARETPDVPDAEIVETPEPDRVAEPEPEQAKPAAEPPTPQKIIERVERRGGFIPMVLGGVAAAAIGFGMARYVLPDDFPFPKPGQTDLTATIDSAVAEARNADLVLAGRIEKLEAGPDLSGLTGAIDAATAAATVRADALETRLTALEAQVADLANRPVTEGASPAATAAYEAELAKLQAAMAEQRANLEAMLTEATAERAAAQMTEQEAMVRNSMTRIRIALENGGPYAADLANLTGVGLDVPAALADRAEAGVPTLAALREAYPAAARAALAAARAGDSAGGVRSVVTELLGARSLAPRDGDDPDAILSRVEAALRDGRMTDALTEVETLPQIAREQMTDWLQLATERATALAALETLAAQATAN